MAKKVPSEGIEPPASEPESEVLSITPRGHYCICSALSLYKVL